MWKHYTKHVGEWNTSNVPLVCFSLSNFHLSSSFESILFQRFTSPKNSIDFHVVSNPDSQGCRERKVEQTSLIRFIESFETFLEDEMIELFMHGHKASTLIDHLPHLNKAKLIQSIGPDIHCAFSINNFLGQSFIEFCCRFQILSILIIF